VSREVEVTGGDGRTGEGREGNVVMEEAVIDKG